MIGHSVRTARAWTSASGVLEAAPAQDAPPVNQTPRIRAMLAMFDPTRRLAGHGDGRGLP